LKQIARLTLLEHGHVVAALAIDQVFQPPASTPKGRGGKKSASASQNIEDADQGESTDETIEEFKNRLEQFVQAAIKSGKKLNGDMDRGRDEYKESGTVFDVRKKVIHEFLKSLSGKKRCEHCGA
jgi:DNA-directed RNA polymerase I subunit RPA1